MAKLRKTFSTKALDEFRKEYSEVRIIRNSRLKEIHTLLDKCSDNALAQLAQANIKIMSGLAIKACEKRNIKLGINNHQKD